MKKSKKISLIVAAVCLVASLCLAGVTIYAWFSVGDSSTETVDLVVTGDQDKGIFLAKIDGGDPVVRYSIYPHRKVVLDLLMTKDIEDFGVYLRVSQTDISIFNQYFGERPTLLNGIYQRGEEIKISAEGKELVFRDFDIDSYLASKNALTLENKVHFLRKFAESNSIHSALSVYALVINGETETKVPFVQNKTLGLYYAANPFFVSVGQSIKLVIEFGLSTHSTDCFYPTMTLEGDAVFEDGTYTAYNYNCFIGQDAHIVFESEVGSVIDR